MKLHRDLFAWGAVIASLAQAETIVVEKLTEPPSGWTRLEAANPNQLIRLSIVLETSGADLVGKALSEISNPKSMRYGRHLSRDEAVNFVSVQHSATQSIHGWLSSNGIQPTKIQDRGHIIDVKLSIEEAEKLLSSHYSVFERDGSKALGALVYSVPPEVRPHIASIQPTTFFGTGKFMQYASRNRSSPAEEGAASDCARGQTRCEEEPDCDKLNTPRCLRRLYHVDNDYSEPAGRSLLGVVGFNEQAAQYDQLELYLNKFAGFAKGANFSTELINNGTNPQGKDFPGGEANMDIQIAVSMAYRVPVKFYATGGENHDFAPDLDISDQVNEHIEPWLQLATGLLELPDADMPQVMSISYGVNEQAVPKAYARKVCQLFGLLAVRGMSIIVASGDTGPGVSCQSNNGTKSARFLSTFPAACPYVTAVGATGGRGPEKAMDFSSGGFSDYWKRPSWQDVAVTKFLNKHGEKWQQYYDRAGRAFPDVSAQGVDYPFFNHDIVDNGGGTSAAAPLFAAMISVLNANRMKHNKPPLGFLNPWLYLHASSAFTDITQGKSEGCKGVSMSGAPASYIPEAGWPAIEGWDPVTGLGTPRFDRLQKLAMCS